MNFTSTRKLNIACYLVSALLLSLSLVSCNGSASDPPSNTTITEVPTTPDVPTTPSIDVTAPTQPTNLRLGANSPTSASVSLIWDSSTDETALASYIVVRDSTEVGNTEETTYTDTTVDPAMGYSFSVIAVDTAGNRSTPSDPLVVTTLAGSDVNTAPSKTYYVSTSGSDSNDGLSLSTPFATISKAHSVVEAGDIIEMRAGTYAGATLSRPGSAASWITLRAYQNENVIIDGDISGGRNETLYFYHEQCEPQHFVPPNNEAGPCPKMYWVVEGLDIKGGNVYAVEIDMPFVKLINNKIHDSVADNVKLVKTANDVVIFGNEIYKSGALGASANAQGVDIVGADRTWVANNYVHHISSIGMYAKGNARDTIFENNRVEDILDSGIQLGQETDLDKLPDGDYESYNGIIRNNIIVRTHGPCLQTSSSKDVKIYNNSCYDVAIDSQGAIRLADESLTSTLAENIEIKNNIIVVSPNSSRPAVKVSADALANFATLDIDNNLYWTTNNSGTISFDWQGSTKTSLSSWTSSSAQDSASDVANPLYNDPINTDLTLSSGASPAVDAGLANSSVVALDYNSANRPASGVDIGAYEFGATLPTYGAHDMPTTAGASTLFRYPFLQTSHATSMKILWGVTEPGNAQVYLRDATGSTIIQSLAMSAEQIVQTSVTFYQLAIQFDNLAPNTEYKYDIIHNGIALARGMDFKTMPSSNSDTVNAVVFGDTGVDYSVVRSVRNEIARKDGGSFVYPHDFIIGVGDIAYNSGTYAEFNTNFFGQLSGKNDSQPNNSILSDRPFFASLGNHEYGNNLQTLPAGYLSSFSLPVDGSIPTEDKERYYSFDSGNAHFVIIDSMKFVSNVSDATAARLPEMLAWLNADLAASTKVWKLVFFHHAIFSNGGHGTYGDIGENRTLRQKLSPILQQNGVQMVMFGHDHMYQRSVPLKIISNEADPDFGRIVRLGNGEIDQTNGIVYVLTGHGGADFHNMATPFAAYGTATWNDQVNDYGIGYDFAADNGGTIFDGNSAALKPGFSHLVISPSQLDLNVYTHEGFKLDTYTMTP